MTGSAAVYFGWNWRAARGCRARSTKQRARLDRLEALKAGKTPLKEQNVEMDSIETRMGKKTIEFHHVSKTIEGLSFDQ